MRTNKACLADTLNPTNIIIEVGIILMLFINDVHEQFYSKHRSTDVYRNAFFYSIGICTETRERVEALYDFEERCVRPEAVFAAWQTSETVKVSRLAFSLFTDGVPSAYELKGEEAFQECRLYSVSDIFCCGYASYFFQAIKLRYPEYTGG